MQASEIRRRFLNFFEKNGHSVRASASLVPADDPTLLFVNAGMVPFKRIFLGLDKPEFGTRYTTSQKCVRAGGKHNDLEQVGHTARHQTFFEMLGNFSFGDYFKRDAIRFAWEFVTKELKIDPKYLRVTVFEDDAEARALWAEIAGLPQSRIYGLGAHDNFWQMADTGPCGPCSEIFVDLAHIAKDWSFPQNAKGEWTELDREEFSLDAFVEGTEAGRFLEFWNLVFMQFDKQENGELKPLPKPSVDTGMGLERVSGILQGVTNNFHIDLFASIIDRVSEIVGIPYKGRESGEKYEHVFKGPGKGERSAAVKEGGRLAVDPASFRVVADHARAVAFLLADGVFPSNEGRGYVLRRILRRAVRHAWLLGRAAPTLTLVVETVIDAMGDSYPELRQRKSHIIETTRAEEERFLATIDGGMKRFEELAPVATTQGSTEVRGTISGEDAFRLYDTFGFPIDLTELMARERGYTVDIPGFERSLQGQRTQSKEDRKTRKLGVAADELAAEWSVTQNGKGKATDVAARETPATSFVGYSSTDVSSDVVAIRKLSDGRVALMLSETPFYAESGGQISDAGEIRGKGWTLDVEEVRKVDGRTAVIGKPAGDVTFGPAHASVPRRTRLDTERNHTATHLLHAALRAVLGEHVHQAGSLVAPDRLRFDFTHHGPMKAEEIAAVEAQVNSGILEAVPLRTEEKPYAEAVGSGAMALFGEKYGDVVRVVTIPGLSVELCGGTHVRNTSEIGIFRILSETGVAAGVRRIEAATGSRAFEYIAQRETELDAIQELTRSPAGQVVKRVQSLVEEKRTLEKRLQESVRGGGDTQVRSLIESSKDLDGVRVISTTVQAGDMKTLQALGDSLREQLKSGVAVLAASFEEGKNSLVAVITDDLRERGLRADVILREVAAIAGGKGGGKPHMAQAGVPDASKIPEALSAVEKVVRSQLSSSK
jgi:alanyl-tRNA synthetase